jgi:hypothetical protein
MHNVMRKSMSHQSAVSRAGLRVPSGLTHLWTGRARVSTATNTVIPRCVATTTHRTRVSDMRDSASRLDCGALQAPPFSAETLTSKRRDSGIRLHSSG